MAHIGRKSGQDFVRTDVMFLVEIRQISYARRMSLRTSLHKSFMPIELGCNFKKRTGFRTHPCHDLSQSLADPLLSECAGAYLEKVFEVAKSGQDFVRRAAAKLVISPIFLGACQEF